MLPVAGLVLPEVEEAVDDGVHHGVGAGEDEEGVLDALVNLHKRVLVEEKPEEKKWKDSFLFLSFPD